MRSRIGLFDMQVMVKNKLQDKVWLMNVATSSLFISHVTGCIFVHPA